MSTRSPLRAVQLYNDEVWTGRKRELVTALLANPLRRHHPGGTQIFSHGDMLERYDGYMARFPKFEAVARQYICEGPYVTLVWDIHMAESGGPTTTISSIEIFKVESGLITDVWNPNEIAESYPRGPWPEVRESKVPR